MKRFALSLMVVASTVFAQEIGTEISPTTPTSGAETEVAPPPPPPSPSKGATKKASKTREVKAGGWDGEKVSASGGDFGIRAGFGASGSTALPTGTGAAARAVAAPTVGVSLMAGDAFKLLIDLGFGLAILGSNTVFAMSTMVGFDYLFRTPGDALRPLIHAGASLNLVIDAPVSFGVQFGFGAEYFFDPAFSINGRLMLAVPMGFAGDFVVGLFTVTPGVGATWYF